MEIRVVEADSAVQIIATDGRVTGPIFSVDVDPENTQPFDRPGLVLEGGCTFLDECPGCHEHVRVLWKEPWEVRTLCPECGVRIKGILEI